MSRDEAPNARLAAFLAGGPTLPLLPWAAGDHEHVHWSGATAHELLTFAIGGQLHALAIREVREVAKLPPLLRVPRRATWVLGLMNLRGDLVPVLDGAQVFAALPTPSGALHAAGVPPLPVPAGARPKHVVVLGSEEAPLGLAVDRLFGVRRLPDGAVVPRSPLGGTSAGKDCIAGFATLGPDTVVVLDGEAVQQRFAEL